MFGIRSRETTELLSGMDWEHRPPHGRPPGTDYDPAAAWLENRGSLIAYWTQDPRSWSAEGIESGFGTPKPKGPGHRPWGFWRYEAIEPRRMIRGGKAVAWLDDPGMEAVRADWHGERKEFSGTFGRLSQTFAYPRFWDIEFESEIDYLRRLGRLTPEEEGWLREHRYAA